MFERYTERARRVIFFARYEASQFGSPTIETEHLLLGILRESKWIVRLLPQADPAAIRKQIEAATPVSKLAQTPIDLPLSLETKRVLTYATDEAERLNHRHIGTEHLLLGLLHENDFFAARLLIERGADLDKLRTEIQKQGEHAFDSTKSYGVLANVRARLSRLVEIHGMQRSADQIQEAVKRCREYSWHWQKRTLAARDVVVHRKTGAISFEVILAAEDPTNFELLKAGWKRKDHCAVCHWELSESDDAAHGTGYTNGRDWLCNECYDKFWERPDFISGSYSDLT